MSNWDLKLISYWLDHPDAVTTKTVLHLGREFMLHPNALSLYDYLGGYMEDVGQLPSLDAMQEVFPRFKPPPYTENLGAIVRELTRKKKAIDIQELAYDMLDAIEEGQIDEAYDKATLGLADMTSLYNRRHTTELGLEDCGLLIDEYNYVREHKGVIGIPFYHNFVTEATRGMLPKQLIVYYGLPGHGKTWLGALTITAALRSGYNVIFWTNEMDPLDILRRVTAIELRLDYDRVLHGLLTPDEHHMFLEGVEALKNGGLLDGNLHITDEADQLGRTDVPLIRSMVSRVEATKFEVHLVVLDGIHRLHDSSDGKKIKSVEHAHMTNICQACKNSIARSLDKAVLAISQANAKGAETRGEEAMIDMGYTKALVQEADIILRVHLNKRKKEWYIMNPKLRESASFYDGFTTAFLPAIDFELKERSVPDYIEKKQPYTPRRGGSRKAVDKELEDVDWSK